MRTLQLLTPRLGEPVPLDGTSCFFRTGGRVRPRPYAGKSVLTDTFLRHFKELTSLSPLQYQKRLRLYEAQRLMLVERHDANRAGLAVGYESTAQFSREYKRLFGEPPLRDVRRLR